MAGQFRFAGRMRPGFAENPGRGGDSYLCHGRNRGNGAGTWGRDAGLAGKFQEWLSLEAEPSIWISFVLSMGLLALVMRKG